MRNPVVLHVVRPYSDEREYLAAEAWTIDDRGMFLIVDRVLEADTTVVFDVALTSGMKVIRAEARVEHHVPAEGAHPAGLRVKFRRFGAQTKAFIERALGYAERRTSAPVTQRSVSRPPPPPSARRSIPSPGRVPDELRATPQSEVPRSYRNLTPPAGMPLPLHTQRPTSLPPSASMEGVPTSQPLDSEPSGVHAREREAHAALTNRDELLARLRERSKSPESGERGESATAESDTRELVSRPER